MKFFPPKTLLIFSIIASLSVPTAAFATDNDNAVFILKDDLAPYDGVLLPLKQAEQVRRDLIEVKTLRAINESYAKSIQMYQQTIQLSDQKYNTLLNQNDKLALSLVESRKSSDLQKMIWFGLGVLATGFAVYGAKKITE
jgi:hypothetical protein